MAIHQAPTAAGVGWRFVRRPPNLLVCVYVGALAGLQLLAAGDWPWRDPLSMFSGEGRVDLRAGAAVVQTLRETGANVAVIGAARTTADPEALVAWSREVERQRGRYVPLNGRFSSPPRIDDVATLVLDDRDLEDLKNCRPGHCDVKLSEREIRDMQAAIRAAGNRWREAAVETFRALVVSRARTFEVHGFRRIEPYADARPPIDPAAEFQALVEGFGQDPLFTPGVAQYLGAYPRSASEVESFLYWSKDLLGDAKPIISVTQMSIVRGAPYEPTIVAATQVYATHYLNASLSLMTISGCPGEEGRYLVYTRRSRADVFGGAFGGMVRRGVNKRVRAEGVPVLDRLRRTLERGPAAQER